MAAVQRPFSSGPNGENVQDKQRKKKKRRPGHRAAFTNDALKSSGPSAYPAFVRDAADSTNPIDVQLDASTTQNQHRHRNQRRWRNSSHGDGQLLDSGNPKLPEAEFESYWSMKDVADGLKRGELIQGAFRVNMRNYREAFVSDIDRGRDICIESLEHRNRALQGDVVAIKLRPKSEWRKEKAGPDIAVGVLDVATADESAGSVSDGCYQKTGMVVHIIERKHPRVATGNLRPYRNGECGFAQFSPVDSRIPRIAIPLQECPEAFLSRPKDFEKTLFIARITDWPEKSLFATGHLMRSLGEAGEIEPETEGFLVANCVDFAPFDQAVIDCLPEGNAWSIPESEIAGRRDLRKECVFTIDPSTARDLDDALSCRKIGDNTYEVGVHIADVSYFIPQGNALDQAAKSRATSVYLTQRVIPMLPGTLCENLCSLNPGTDRLSYSVIWTMRSDGAVLSEWFGRTIINSCVKLSYDHAQQFIESSDIQSLEETQFPKVYGDHNIFKICSTVKVLHRISQFLRQRRFDSGALRLDQPKLAFSLDRESGLPNGCAVYEYKDSNRMIEEFMLLANMAVGRKILSAHPDRAILRNHPPPQSSMMNDVGELCRKHGIEFDVSSSSSISRSLQNVLESVGENSKAVYAALVMLCAKPFQNARYFCAGFLEDETLYHHYALNVPIYTHFTSPIRRYPDVMVHRFLTAALDPSYEVAGSVDELQRVAEHCNEKKWAAKRCQEASSELFFSIYVKECGPLLEKGVVVNILSSAVDVLCLRLGLVRRVYADKLSLKGHEVVDVGGKVGIKFSWKPEPPPINAAEIDMKLAALKEKFESSWTANSPAGKPAASATTRKHRRSVADRLESLQLAAESPPASVHIEKAKKPREVSEVSETVATIEQTLTLFSTVDVLLQVSPKDPTTLLMVLKNPHNEEDAPDVGL